MKPPAPYETPGLVVLIRISAVFGFLAAVICVLTVRFDLVALWVGQAVSALIVAEVISYFARTAHATQQTRDILVALTTTVEQLARRDTVPPAPEASSSDSKEEPVAEPPSADRVRRDRANAPHRASNQRRLEEMKLAGISEVRVMAPAGETVCPVCRGMLNRIIPIDSAPQLPPPACTCEPHGRCTFGPAG